MAKPFADSGGNGLHIHTSLHDGSGANVFNDTGGQGTPALSSTLHHAVGGMAVTMAEAMAIFAPNANSYRRFLPGSYVPLSPCWGYNHRGVSMRIPVSSDQNRRVEHRVAGADANPYLVTAAVLAGMHYGITHRCEPEPMITEGVDMSGQQASLPIRWEQALDAFARSSVMPGYLGENYCSAFHSMRRAEAEAYHARISNLDYEWYLRAV
jgi:glutamine synthetase